LTDYGRLSPTAEAKKKPKYKGELTACDESKCGKCHYKIEHMKEGHCVRDPPILLATQKMPGLTASTQERFHTKPFQSFRFRQDPKSVRSGGARCTLHLYNDKNCENQFNEMSMYVAVKGGPTVCKEVTDNDPADTQGGHNTGAGPAKSALIKCDHTGAINWSERDQEFELDVIDDPNEHADARDFE